MGRSPLSERRSFVSLQRQAEIEIPVKRGMGYLTENEWQGSSGDQYSEQGHEHEYMSRDAKQNEIPRSTYVICGRKCPIEVLTFAPLLVLRAVTDPSVTHSATLSPTKAGKTRRDTRTPTYISPRWHELSTRCVI